MNETAALTGRIRETALLGLKGNPGLPRAENVMKPAIETAERYLDEHLDPGEVARIACRPGCGACCMVNVAVLFPEAAAIHEHLVRHLSPAALKGTVRRIRELHDRTRGMGEEARVLAQESCAFLDEWDCCEIHPVRPFLCRSITSVDPEQCRRAIRLAALEGGPPILMNLGQKAIMDAAFVGLAEALEELGLDARSIRLTQAMNLLFERPEFWGEYLEGHRLPCGAAEEPHS